MYVSWANRLRLKLRLAAGTCQDAEVQAASLVAQECYWFGASSVADRPILLAAIAARATHLLTGDVKHFGRLFGRRVEGVVILTPGDYLRGRARR